MMGDASMEPGGGVRGVALRNGQVGERWRHNKRANGIESR